MTEQDDATVERHKPAREFSQKDRRMADRRQIMLQHINLQLAALGQGAPAEILFQSFAGTERTVSEEVDVTVEFMDWCDATPRPARQEAAPLSDAILSLYAVANGDLVLKRDNPTDATTTFNWEQPQPMSTYLAALSVSDYVVLQDSTYDWIYYFVYSWDVEDALGSFQNVNFMMDRFESVYAPYPWTTKFSYVETPGGDMEHLTEVYHIAFAINGSTNYDWLLAHEMSHHWWGDCLQSALRFGLRYSRHTVFRWQG